MASRASLTVLVRPGLIWAVGFVLMAELILRVWPSAGFILGSNMDFHRYYFEEQVRADASALEVLVIGDSAIQNSLHPRLLAEGLGLPREKLAVLAYGGGSPNTFTPFLRENLSRMPHLKTVVWIMNDYRFTNKGCVYSDHVTMDLASLRKIYAGQLFRSDYLMLWGSRLYRLAKLFAIRNVRDLFYMRWIQSNESGYFLPTGGGWMMLPSAVRPLPLERNVAVTDAPAIQRGEDLSYYKAAQFCEVNADALVDLAALVTHAGVRLDIYRHVLRPSARVYLEGEAPEIFAHSATALDRIKGNPGVFLHLDELSNFRPSSPAYYGDMQHLDYFGAVEYSAYVASRLAGIIEERH